MNIAGLAEPREARHADDPFQRQLNPAKAPRRAMASPWVDLEDCLDAIEAEFSYVNVEQQQDGGFLIRPCPACGVSYATAREDDEGNILAHCHHNLGGESRPCGRVFDLLIREGRRRRKSVA